MLLEHMGSPALAGLPPVNSGISSRQAIRHLIINSMRMKNFIITIWFILFSFVAYSQVKIGVNVLPGMLVNRVSSESDTLSYSNDGVGYKIALGILFDFETQKNYYFSTGLYWFPKRAGFKLESSEGTETYSYKLQYIQIPFNIKLLTDEFSIDKRFIFQFGLAFEMKIDEKGKYLEEIYLEKFNFLDIVLDFGIGLDMKMGQNTSIFTGITYYRGLLNIVQPQSFLKGDFKAKSDYWALNLGIKF